MTAQDIFAKAAAYLSQTPEESEDLAVFAPLWLNALVVEALPYENDRRRLAGDLGRPVLESAPNITSLADDIPYSDDICRVALPYGLASQFFIDDTENYMAQDFRARFIAALNETTWAKEEGVVNYYA